MTRRARINRVALLIPLLAILFAVSLGLLTSGIAHAANTSGCYGSGCNGLNPSGRCDGDAVTARAMDVPEGVLELRYSPSCRANWGRYTPYRRTAFYNYWQNQTIYARVTAWNPGGPSYGTAYHAGVNIFESSWSYMTDGRPTACTGVEVVIVGDHADTTSEGWTWGPCY